eukprot:3439979-Prymnesium_polylepis.1
MRDLLYNGPYINYVFLKLFLAFADGLPGAVMVYFVKFYVKYEQSNTILNITMIAFCFLSGLILQVSP